MARGAVLDWNTERRELLAELWPTESVMTIAQRIGYSHHACTMQALRMALPSKRRPHGADPSHRPDPLVIRRPMDTLPPLPSELGQTPDPAPLANVPPGTPHPFLNRPRSACDWPMGAPNAPGFRFCDEPADLGRAYCPEHTHHARSNNVPVMRHSAA